jgi:tetraacyldisaccharide 4'-kinase
LAYGAVLRLRNAFFDLGIFRSMSFPIPIISVGNLEVGGTGKSPLSLHICNLLLVKGFRVALLSRGHGRSSSGFIIVEVESDAHLVGDEPLQAKLRYPELQVAVCEDRREGIRELLRRNDPPSVILLDDAFQHRWVKPTLSIITSPSSRPFWKNFLLPVGSLREPASGSKRADILVLTGDGNEIKDVCFAGGVFRCSVISGLPVHFSGKIIPLHFGDSVVLLSGIANAERFVASAKQHFSLLAEQCHSDHHRFTANDILRLRERFHSFAPAAKAILITEKDAARLRNNAHLALLNDIPVYYLPIGLKWNDNGEKRFENLILDHVDANKRDS